MATSLRMSAAHTDTMAPTEHPVAVAGRLLTRYGFVIVIAWIGALKFAGYEAAGIQPLISHSPFMSWLYDIFGVQSLSSTLGTAEIVSALLIALAPWAPKLSVVGSAFAVLLFLGTLSFIVTTPGVFLPGHFAELSALPGQFLIKDVALFGVAVWTLGESLGRARK